MKNMKIRKYEKMNKMNKNTQKYGQYIYNCTRYTSNCKNVR